MKVFRRLATCRAGILAALAVITISVQAQQEQHGRKFKPLPPTAHVVVTVEKGFNSKPLENAAVIFHAVRDGKEDANLEVKTDPDGKATIDLLEVGSHVTLQVIASGFATYATQFDVTTDADKEMLVKLERPRAQVSEYQDNDGKPAVVKPGIQEHIVPKAPAPGTPAATSPATTPATPPPTTPAMPAETAAPAPTNSPVRPQ